jgi:hypothetical protein
MQAAAAFAKSAAAATTRGVIRLGKGAKVYRAPLNPTRQVGRQGLKGVRNAAKEAASKHIRGLAAGQGPSVLFLDRGDAGGAPAYTVDLGAVAAAAFYPAYCSCSVPTARSLMGMHPDERMVRCSGCGPHGAGARKALATLRGSTRRRSRASSRATTPPATPVSAANTGSKRRSGSKRNATARLPASA